MYLVNIYEAAASTPLALPSFNERVAPPLRLDSRSVNRKVLRVVFVDVQLYGIARRNLKSVTWFVPTKLAVEAAAMDILIFYRFFLTQHLYILSWIL